MLTVTYKPDGTPITNPEFKDGCWVFTATPEDQRRIEDWNWKAIKLLAAELQKRREPKLPPPED